MAEGRLLFGVPGFSTLERGEVAGALADRVVAYDRDWSVTLHAPYLDHIGHGSRDMFSKHTLAPGASRTFEAWLQVGASGDLAPVVRADIALRHLPGGTVRGVVIGSLGKPVEGAVVVVRKHGKPYAWVLSRDGAYELTLPVGEYSLYATAAQHAQSMPASVSIAAGTEQVRDFHDVAEAGLVHFSVASLDGKPLDARIAIVDGQRPLVRFLGRTRFFTDLDQKGHVDVALAPGDYRFRVSAGGDFLGPSREETVSIAPGLDRIAAVNQRPGSIHRPAAGTRRICTITPTRPKRSRRPAIWPARSWRRG